MFFTQQVLSAMSVMVNKFVSGHSEDIIKHIVQTFRIRSTLDTYTVKINRA